MSDEYAAQLTAMLEQVSCRFGEHFDSFQIMATTTENEGTRSWFRGSGNWFARQGLAHEFIGREQAELTGQGVATQMKKE